MSSQIKFRVWDGETMHEPPHNWCVTDQGVARLDADHTWKAPVRGFAKWGHLGEWAIMWYTGLTDGEDEIYEGDVLRVGDEHAIVHWREDQAAYYAKYITLPTSVPLKIAVDRPTPGIVIGNKYEPPNLLDKVDA